MLQHGTDLLHGDGKDACKFLGSKYLSMGRPAKCWLVSAMLCPWNGAVYNKAIDISQQVYGMPCYYICGHSSAFINSPEQKAHKVSL